MSKIKTIATETGFGESVYVAIENLKYYQEIRKICEENTCHNYATSRAYPPAVRTIAECKARVNQYDKGCAFCCDFLNTMYNKYK